MVLILGVITAVWLRRPFPETEGEVERAGLTEKVDVYRDASGTPQIYAKNRRDMLFANGYVHAQDWFWQMEVSRRAAQGRLAEVLGASALEADRLNRLWGYNQIATKVLAFYRSEHPLLAGVKKRRKAVSKFGVERRRGRISVTKNGDERLGGGDDEER